MDPISSIFSSQPGEQTRGQASNIPYPSLTYTLTSIIKILALKQISPHELRNTRIHVGEGGTSTVFKTLRLPIFAPKLVAVKQKRRKGSYIDKNVPLEAWLRNCCADLRIMGDDQLDSPNLVKVLGYYWEHFEMEGTRYLSPCLIMPLADCSLGGLFQELHKSSASLSLKGKLQFCADISSGISCLHSQGIVHGDIKMDNVLIFQTSGGFLAKISDFTHSIFLSNEHTSVPRYTGTRPFWPPEVRAMDRSEGEFVTSGFGLLACDVYQLGVLLWRILNGGLEFVDLMEAAYDLAHQGDERPFGEGFYLVMDRAVFESTDTLLDSLYEHPFAFAYLCVSLLSYQLRMEHDASSDVVDDICKCLKECVTFAPHDRSSARVVQKRLQRLVADPSGTSHDESDDRPSYPFAEAIWYNDLRFQELAYFIAQEEAPITSEILQAQIFREVLESARVYSSGDPHMMLSMCYALGFGTKFDANKMLYHLQEAALKGELAASLLLPRIHHIVTGDEVTEDVLSKIEAATKTWNFGFVPRPIGNNNDLSPSNSAYFGERLREQKINWSDHRRIRIGGTGNLDEEFHGLDGLNAAELLPELTSGLFLISSFDSLSNDGDMFLLNCLRAAERGQAQESSEERTASLKLVYDITGFSWLESPGARELSPLLRACQLGRADLVKALISHGLRANIQDSFGLSPLHWLPLFDDKDIGHTCRLLINAGANINATTTVDIILAEHSLMFPPGSTSLHFAVAMRNVTAVRVLLSLGADRDICTELALARNYYKLKPLHFAVCLHFYDIVALLLDKGDPGTVSFRKPSKEYSEISILHLVTVPVMMRGNTAPFLPILAHGIALEDAVQRTLSAIAPILPAHKGLNTNKHPLTTISVQYGACSDSLQALARFVKDREDIGKAKVSKSRHALDFWTVVMDEDWSTVLSCLCSPQEQLLLAAIDGSAHRKSSPDVVNAVLSSLSVDLSTEAALYFFGICVDWDLDGPLCPLRKHCSALGLSLEEDETMHILKRATMNNSSEVLKLILQNESTGSEGSPLHKLFSLPKNVASVEFEGQTLLHLAAGRNAVAALNILLDHGADINASLPSRGTPLAVAAERLSSRDAATCLLQRGASLYCNPEEGPGYSVLHAAAEITDTLLEGAQQFSMGRVMVEAFPAKFTPQVINSRDDSGETALHAAAQRCDFEMIKLLVELGCEVGVERNDGKTALVIALVSGTFTEGVDKDLTVSDSASTDDNKPSWYLRRSWRIAEYLIENGSPIPEKEPLSGEYTCLINLACQLANRQATPQKAIFCLSKLRFPNFSHEDCTAKIGLVSANSGPPWKFVAFDPKNQSRSISFHSA